MGTTPYNLVYGIEAVIPLGLEILTLRISLQGLVDNNTYKAQRLHQLELLDEQCINALKHLQAYTKQLQQKHDSHVIPQTFTKGDLVLYENQQNSTIDSIEKGKFSPNWLGPYIINTNYRSSTYTLTKLDSTPLKYPINVAHLHWYYV